MSEHIIFAACAQIESWHNTEKNKSCCKWMMFPVMYMIYAPHTASIHAHTHTTHIDTLTPTHTHTYTHTHTRTHTQLHIHSHIHVHTHIRCVCFVLLECAYISICRLKIYQNVYIQNVFFTGVQISVEAWGLWSGSVIFRFLLLQMPVPADCNSIRCVCMDWCLCENTSVQGVWVKGVNKTMREKERQREPVWWHAAPEEEFLFAASSAVVYAAVAGGWKRWNDAGGCDPMMSVQSTNLLLPLPLLLMLLLLCRLIELYIKPLFLVFARVDALSVDF